MIDIGGFRVCIRSLLRHRMGDERGASLVEYAFLLALIAVVCIAAVTFIGGQTNTSLSEVGSELGS